MKKEDPVGVSESPLTQATARKIMNDLAEHHTSRIRWSRHLRVPLLIGCSLCGLSLQLQGRSNMVKG